MNNYQLSSVHETNLTNQNGVYQDSLLTYAADRSGRFWALLGHTNLDGISVWSGSSLLDLKKEYDAQYCFALGRLGRRFPVFRIRTAIVPRTDLAVRTVDQQGNKPVLLPDSQ